MLVNGGNQPCGANGNYNDNDKDNHDEANNGDFHDFGEHDGDDAEHPFMDEDVLNMVSSFTNWSILVEICETLIRSFEFECRMMVELPSFTTTMDLKTANQIVKKAWKISAAHTW